MMRTTLVLLLTLLASSSSATLLLSDENPASLASNLHRHLQTVDSYGMACAELRMIFHNQCSCGEFTSSTSDRIECAYNDISAEADFDNNFELRQLRVCNQVLDDKACTTIHYGQLSEISKHVALYCEAAVGGAMCNDCLLCTTDSGRLGLELDCDNRQPALTTSGCTEASQVLDLSAGSYESVFWGAVVGLVVAVVGVL